MKTPNYILSVDAETNGLWGQPFSIGAVVYRDGVEVNSFQARMPDSTVDNLWVKDNVLPALDIPVTHDSYESMLKDFAFFYVAHKDATTLWHMGHVVEAFLFRECVRLRFLDEFDAPYTPIEVSETLRIAGYDPSSVDSYAKEKGLLVPAGSTHDPLYDCKVAAAVFFHLEKNR